MKGQQELEKERTQPQETASTPVSDTVKEELPTVPDTAITSQVSGKRADDVGATSQGAEDSDDGGSRQLEKERTQPQETVSTPVSDTVKEELPSVLDMASTSQVSGKRADNVGATSQVAEGSDDGGSRQLEERTQPQETTSTPIRDPAREELPSMPDTASISQASGKRDDNIGATGQEAAGGDEGGSRLTSPGQGLETHMSERLANTMKCEDQQDQVQPRRA